MSEDSTRPIGVDLDFQCLFDSAFRGHRIHALPPKGRTRVWDAPPETTPWIEAARAWMERQKGCKFYFSPGTIKPGILRINEARDMGESKVDRYQFYERTKTLMASPPETLTVQEKYLKRYSIMNLVCIIITTNNKTNGLYLKSDDRRHFVAWSPLTEADFEAGYFTKLWDW